MKVIFESEHVARILLQLESSTLILVALLELDTDLGRRSMLADIVERSVVALKSFGAILTDEHSKELLSRAQTAVTAARGVQ